MRGWLFGLVMLVGMAVAASAPAQQSETRIALIIANEAYASPNLGRLPGTKNDAMLMQAALQRAGFAVTVQRDLNRDQMRAALSAFRGRLAALGQSGVGFLYYSGHGVADGPRGQNYLVPVDAQISNVTDLPSTSLALNEELDGIALAGAHATIIVIDACRNTPVALGRGSRGLAAVSARTDTLIAFSTDTGETASDDGLYARTLSDELSKPGVDAANVFAHVQTRVAQATQRTQRPRYDNGLIEPIVFVPGIVTAAAPPVVSTPVVQAPRAAQAPPPVASQPAATVSITSLVGRWRRVSLSEGHVCSDPYVFSLQDDELVWTQGSGGQAARMVGYYSITDGRIYPSSQSARSLEVSGDTLTVYGRDDAEVLCTYRRSR